MIHILLILPLARAGFKISDISIDHSLLPAPTILWISSINKITSPQDCSNSFIILFKRSSKSHLYLLPDIKEARSISTIFLFNKKSGTSFFTILWASPSIIELLPTHGSPTNKGLFFLLRERISIT